MIEEIKITSLSGRGTLFLKRGEYWGYWLGPVDWGTASAQHNTYAYYNQVGKSIVSSTLGTRPLSITGWVLDAGTGDMQKRCDFLNSFISPAEDYELEYKGKKIGFRPDDSVYYPPDYLKNNEKVRRFLIEATCPFPLFSDVENTAVLFDQTKKMFRFPTDFGQKKPVVFANISRAYQLGINNPGGFASGMLVRIIFTGEVKNPRVKSLTTDQFIGVRRTFQRGETLEVSTIPGSKRMTLLHEDGTSENILKDRDYEMNWMQLQPGVNQIAVDCDDADQRMNMDLTIHFTPLYLEVE